MKAIVIDTSQQPSRHGADRGRSKRSSITATSHQHESISRKRIMRKLIIAILLLVVWTPAVGQLSQGTAFSYQGRLTQSGTPLQGSADLTFALFDAVTAGNQVGSTLLFTAANGNPVAVDSGVFDVVLDFGALAFNGLITEQRFLRITVNGTVLIPRTPIQNSPYSLQSRTAELAYAVSNGAIGSTQIDAAQVQRRVGASCASGSSIQSVNVDGTVSCQSAGSGTITGVTAGSGLSGGGTSGGVSLSADTSVMQTRVTGTCASGSSIRVVAADGTVTCQSGGSGTITGVTPGRGLFGGGSSGSVTLGIIDPLNLSGADGNGVILAQSTRSTDGIGVHGVISSDSGAALFGDSSATAGSGIGVEGNNASPSGVGVAGYNFALSGLATAVSGQTAAPNGLAIAGYNNATSGANAGVYGVTASTAGYGVWGRSFGSIGDLIAGTGVRGDSGGGTGVLGTSYAAAAATPVAGVVGKNSGNGFGVWGEQLVGPGGAGVFGNGAYAGIWGNANTGVGVLGQTQSGTGVSGNSYANGIGASGNSNYIGVRGGGLGGTATYGVYGTGSIGVYGTGTSGVYGAGTNGVYGNGSNYGVFGSGVTGVRGESTSTSGFGMVGYDSASTGLTRGVYGQSDSPNGRAVEGYSGPGVGIYGASTSGYAGYFAGNVQMSNFVQVWGNIDHEGNLATFQHQVWIYGTLSKPAGSFKIDDPIDPANKYLYHSFVESPDMKNIYDGVATLDAGGEAWVELPAYFEALNRDFRYQLTALGRPAPSLYIADEISGNRFRIAGGNPGQRVSWQTTGTRHDAYAEANRIPNEVDKSANEKGRYLYPELFGQTRESAIRPGHLEGQGGTESPAMPVLPPPPASVTPPTMHQ
jgi:trimeric autotransporter adhesin